MFFLFKKYSLVKVMHMFIVCTSKNIQKEGGVLDRTATFRGVLLGKRGVTFFWGGGGGAIFTKK